MTQRRHRRMPHIKNVWLLAALAFLSFGLGLAGFLLAGVDKPLELVYRTFQLFFVDFDRTGLEMNWLLEAARFGGLTTAVWAIFKVFFPQIWQFFRRLSRRSGIKSCAVILGYGPVGQAIGAALWQRNCGINRVTAVHPAVTPQMIDRARTDGVLLIQGDPSDPRIMKHVYVQKAQRVYISDPDDLRAIDTAVAVRHYLADMRKDIRIVLHDSALAAQLAEASATGFLGAPGLRWFSVADETARLLMADARFDRFALETGASRMHLVVVGGGLQGEAAAIEALLTAWRIGLGPPKITFLDRNIAPIRARMKRRMPALFPDDPSQSLYAAGRPEIDFIECDADSSDFGRSDYFDGLRTGVSGWVFAMGNDRLNLRASLALHRAVMMRQLDPAPIHVRIPTGHVEDVPELSANPLSLAHTFGSIDKVIARSPLLARDPDEVPRVLHREYLKAESEMFGWTSPDWDDLPETKREANRALFRHAVMKIEDMGSVAVVGSDGEPVTHPSPAETVGRVDESLLYDRIRLGTEPQAWLKTGAELSEADLGTAILIRDAALCEHNRWTTERALAQFVPTEHPDDLLRDDIRRHHNNMHNWFELGDAATRRYDVVMMRVLLSQRADAPEALHRRARVRSLFLVVDGAKATCESLSPEPAILGDVSEIHLRLSLRSVPDSSRKTVDAVLSCVNPHIDPKRYLLPARIRFDFAEPPGEEHLALANEVAEALQRDLPQSTLIDGFWHWRNIASPLVGVVGHRDLREFGGDGRVQTQLRQTFLNLVTSRGVSGLVTGYAPGTDRAAVAAWASLGLPRPILVFPYGGGEDQGEFLYHTEEPDRADGETTLTRKQASSLGLPVLPTAGSGKKNPHRAQAEEVVARSQHLVFVVDEAHKRIEGGTLDTLLYARQKGRPVVIIPPLSNA